MIQGLAIAGLWKPELSNRLAIHTEEDFRSNHFVIVEGRTEGASAVAGGAPFWSTHHSIP